MIEAVVIKSTGSWYLLKNIMDNQVIKARIRGKFKLQNIKTTNPIAVGDYVGYILGEDSVAWIINIFPRKNYLIRKSVNLSKQSHILASNIDLVCVFFTIKLPQTSLGFLNKILINCEAYNIIPIIIFNKIDILDENDLERLKQIKSTYQKIGYQTIEISALKKTNIDSLREVLKNKTSVFVGHSGSGKSSAINSLNDGFEIKTSNISSYNQKGKHTTTFAQMYDWDFGGNIIDIPGINEFELIDINYEEIQDYFPEIFKLKKNCKYYNCLHLNEPNCAIKEAIEKDIISKERYNHYINLLNEIR